MKKRFMSMEEQEQKEQLDREQDNELMYAQEDGTEQEKAEPKQGAAGRRIEGEDTIMNRMAQWKYSKEQKDELHRMIALGMPTKTILTVFYPETDVRKMREVRKMFQTVRRSAD